MGVREGRYLLFVASTQASSVYPHCTALLHCAGPAGLHRIRTRCSRQHVQTAAPRGPGTSAGLDPVWPPVVHYAFQPGGCKYHRPRVGPLRTLTCSRTTTRTDPAVVGATLVA
jgi:hypothetical protein